MNMFYPDFEKFTLPEQPPMWQVPIAAPVWQLCPKCNGNGSVLTNWDGHGPFSTSCECDVCNGKKIISTFTGLPPL